MSFIDFLGLERLTRPICLLICALAALLAPPQINALDGAAEKSASAKIGKQFLVFPESVVVEQWKHTFRLVNPPQDLKLLNPGQCIRIGIVATGNDRDTFLEETQLSFRVEFAGETQEHPLAPLGGVKQLKPGGADIPMNDPTSVGVLPDSSTVSLGASAESWCVPANAQDGTANIDAEIDSPSGHQKLARTKIPVEGFATGSRLFTNENDFEKFRMGYHYQPTSARLYPALLYFCSQSGFLSSPGAIEIQTAFLGAALKADPATARNLMTRISARSDCPRWLGSLDLLAGGFNIDSVLSTMSESDQQMFKQHSDLPDPYAFDSPAKLPAQLDMLAGIFSATGQFAPIEKIASALAWRSDWDDLDKARKASAVPKDWTPSMGRAAAYSAAGWSLALLYRTDPLAADYIGYMIASPNTPEAVKTELRGLLTNPAFQRSRQ
jgi:hypothetical protein